MGAIRSKDSLAACLHRHGLRRADIPTWSDISADHPTGRQQVRRVELGVWSGGSFITCRRVSRSVSSTGLFPHQCAQVSSSEPDHRRQGASCHYVEGCTARVQHRASTPPWSNCQSGTRGPLPTIQNWANNITTWSPSGRSVRRFARRVGRRQPRQPADVKYPSVYDGPGARNLSVAFASAGQHQDAGKGGSLCAPTLQPDRFKSISKSGGRSSYRGLARLQGSQKSVNVVCRPDHPTESQRHLPPISRSSKTSWLARSHLANR